MALSKPKKRLIIFMGIFGFVALSLRTLFENNWKLDIRSVVSVLVGWLIGMAVMILLLNTRLGDGMEKSKKEEE